MDVSGQLVAQDPGKNPGTIKWKAGWAQSRSGRCGVEKKFLTPAGIRSSDHPALSLIPETSTLSCLGCHVFA